MNKELLAKYKGGHQLTDADVAVLHTYYQGIATALKGWCAPEYALVKSDACKHLERINDMKVARAHEKKVSARLQAVG